MPGRFLSSRMKSNVSVCRWFHASSAVVDQVKLSPLRWPSFWMIDFDLVHVRSTSRIRVATFDACRESSSDSKPERSARRAEIGGRRGVRGGERVKKNVKAFADLELDPDPAAVCLDDLSASKRPAPVLACSAKCGSESAEDLFVKRRIDADAVVADEQRQISVRLRWKLADDDARRQFWIVLEPTAGSTGAGRCSADRRSRRERPLDDELGPRAPLEQIVEVARLWRPFRSN